MEFNYGDKVKLTKTLCNGELKTGSIGRIINLPSGNNIVGVGFDNPFNGCEIINGCYHYWVPVKYLKLINKKSDKKSKDIKYIAYGPNCYNKSDLINSKEQLELYIKEKIYLDGWEKHIIGYKMIPIIEAKLETKSKFFIFAKHKARIKKIKRSDKSE